MSGKKVCAGILVRGIVQGVGYRYFTQRHAALLGITGWSKNMADGTVGLEIEGDEGRVMAFIEELKAGPGLSRVDGVDISWKKFENKYDGFNIK